MEVVYPVKNIASSKYIYKIIHRVPNGVWDKPVVY
jgi:hypothetical protein